MAGYAPAMMAEHALNALKGWFDMASLDISAKLSSNVEFTAYGGRVVHLNADGEFEMGAEGTQMPIFLLQGSHEPDVSNPGMTGAGNFMHQAISPVDNMSGLVATGGIEIETTEFDKTPGSPYAPNDLLTALADNEDIDVGGLICKSRTGPSAALAVRQYTDHVCGVVSRGHYRNEHKVEVLALWPVYLPAAYA